MPRSGTNFIYALLTAADHAKREDGPIDYKYQVDAHTGRGKWVFKTETRIPNNLSHFRDRLLSGELDNLSDRFFVLSHFPAIRPETLFSPRWMNPIILVRHPVSAARSLFYFHNDADKDCHHEEFLRNQFAHIRKFFNYWGAFEQDRSQGGSLVIRYESLIDNPVKCLSRINKYWNLDYDREHLKSAAKACRRDQMLKKVPNDKKQENKRVTANRKSLPDHLHAAYARKAQQSIHFDFNYDLTL